MTRTTLLALFTLTLTASTTSVSAALVSVDYNRTIWPTVVPTVTATEIWRGNLADPLNSGDQVGVWDNGAAPTNWWNYVSGGGTPVSPTSGQLFDVDGSATTLTLALSNPGGSHANNWTGGSPSDHLVSDGYYSASNGGTMTMTIGDLLSGQAYDLIVYHADDHKNETIDVNGVAATAYTGTSANPGYTDGDDYWYFSGLTVNGGNQLVVTVGGTGFQTITGFQIIEQLSSVPEPRSISIVVIGTIGMGLFFWRRKRTV